MSKKLFNTDNITNIANSIRTKLGVTTKYKVSEMSAAIDSIPTGGNKPTLYAPSILINSDYLYITPGDNGSFNSGATYSIYDSDTFIVSTTETEILLHNIITSGRTHTITVKADQTNFNTSSASNSATWVRKEGLEITAVNGDINVSIGINGTLTNAINVSKYNDGTKLWEDWFTGTTGSSTTITVTSGSTLAIWNSSSTWGESDSNYPDITIVSNTGTAKIGGAINSLINGTAIANKQYCFYRTFMLQTAITDITELTLPAENLTGALACYAEMFKGCTAITSIPTLPATTLSNYCYYSMFEDCTAIDDTPTNLPAATLTEGCYKQMFKGCTSLPRGFVFGKTVGTKVTTVAAQAMSSMFEGCTNLWNPVGWSVTSVENSGMYHMFYGCTRMKISLGQGTPASYYAEIWTLPDDISGWGQYAVDNMFGGGVQLENGATATPVASQNLWRART